MIQLAAVICLITMTKKDITLGVTHLMAALLSDENSVPNCAHKSRTCCTKLLNSTTKSSISLHGFSLAHLGGLKLVFSKAFSNIKFKTIE